MCLESVPMSPVEIRDDGWQEARGRIRTCDRDALRTSALSHSATPAFNSLSLTASQLIVFNNLNTLITEITINSPLRRESTKDSFFLSLSLSGDERESRIFRTLTKLRRNSKFALPFFCGSFDYRDYCCNPRAGSLLPKVDRILAANVKGRKRKKLG